MQVASSLVPGLDDILRHRDPRRRATAVRQISELLLQGADRFSVEHLNLFDDVLMRLVSDGDFELRGELAERLAPLANGPPRLIHQLARDEDIRIAGPVLSRSALIDDDALVELARHRGQPHLLAIARRAALIAPVTDVIVRRGDRDVVRALADNAGAEFSAGGYSALIRRAEHDGMLALAVGRRADLAPPLLKDLLACSVDVVRRQLFETATPAQRLSINRALTELSGATTLPVIRRDFAPAQRVILALAGAGQLNEAALLGFAKAHSYEEAVAALSAMSRLRIATLDRLVGGDKNDPLLIIGRSLGLDWQTVRALIAMRLGPGRVVPALEIEDARQNYQRLAQSTAQRVLGFWRSRDG